MATKQLPKANWFVPITRLDEENRIVEGYCYVNERVESDPYNLTRKAMEWFWDAYTTDPEQRLEITASPNRRTRSLTGVGFRSADL